MSTRIECTKCADVIDLEASSITLPFVCESCETIAFQEAIKPAVTAVDASDTEIHEFSTATVENTTLLIEDLEKQVELTQDSLDSANSLIADMSAQLQEDAAALGDLRRMNAALAEENSDRFNKEAKTNQLNERLQQDIGSLIDKVNNLSKQRNDLAVQNQELNIKNLDRNRDVAKFAREMLVLAREWDEREAALIEQIESAEEQVNFLEEKLKLRIGNLEHQVQYYKQDSQYFRKQVAELGALQQRGFFARLFNIKK